MKKILGLDLGVTSIGWALVNEAENDSEKSSIIRLGVRVNPLTADEKTNFEAGKSITTNADRTLKRSMRRNLQRYKLRRKELVDTLKSYGWIDEDSVLAEKGKGTTFQTLKLRAKAAEDEISLEELARVFLIINKKRGYRSSRKTDKSETKDEGSIIDGMQTAKLLSSEGLTPGQYSYRLVSDGKYNLPDFYRSDLQAEFDLIWDIQKKYYPEILTDELKEELKGRNEKQTWAICEKPFGISGIKRTVKGKDLLKENLAWRNAAVNEKLELEQLAVVLQKINAQLKNADSYLGRISDRSKELYFTHQTVGQYQLHQLMSDRQSSLRNQVFYRQDYLDEFDRIWETQSKFHPEMTPDKKFRIRNIIIFYQRPLKSQKGLVAYCEFEKGRKVSPKSSPVFQEFKIWQILNNLKIDGEYLSLDKKRVLSNELSIRKEMSKAEVLKFLFGKPKGHDMNYRKLEGNSTQAVLFQAYSRILAFSGHEDIDLSKESYSEIMDKVSSVFSALGIDTGILTFKDSILGKEMENQPLYRLWHLLYSYTEDNSKTGNDSLVRKLGEEFGFSPEYAKILASVTFDDDYGSLSTKAMGKILHYMKQGTEYSAACLEAGYRHSQRSLTKEEIDAKEYNDRLEILPKNTLRNPVVEKILNQMVNVVNEICGTYGKPDEIRVELARELKKNAEERQNLTEAINRSAKDNKDTEETLKRDFGMTNVSRNSILRYKLFMELKDNGFKTLYSNTPITYEDLFSKRFDIEHIIPQSRLFDDSFSNKTLESKDINIAKGNMTALDFVSEKYGQEGVEEYRSRVEMLYKNGSISKTKYINLLRTGDEIPEDFIQRDLRDTQYISRKAIEMLEGLVKSIVSTSGEITARLRRDWGLPEVLQELNWDKYDRLGMTEYYTDTDGRRIRRIKDWTKRNDHRHHAVDALTVAFTRRSYIQYLNNLNARIPKGQDTGKSFDLSRYTLNSLPQSERCDIVRYIENKFVVNGKFLPPIPLDEFRAEAKRQLDNILVSIKSKNKVVTKNINRTKTRGGDHVAVQLTPRGQLHKETVYGQILQYQTKEENIGSAFTKDKIATIASAKYRNALYQRLAQYGDNPKKAFCGANSLDKSPVYVDDLHTETVPKKVKTVVTSTIYTIRKQVADDLNVDKVIDGRVRRILQSRLEEFGNDPKKAFVNLDDNPIWLNKEKGITIKRVTITGPSNVYALHYKHDMIGLPVLDESGNPIPSDFVNPSNNHHISIFIDSDGNLQEQQVPFIEAVARVCSGEPVVDRNYRYDEGWRFMFSMKQNEYFVFPDENTGFNPSEIDLLDKSNYPIISPNLFRVQKLSSKDYSFRHHLDTGVDNDKNLKDITWKRITSINMLRNVVKVRIDHIGNIVAIGEY